MNVFREASKAETQIRHLRLATDQKLARVAHEHGEKLSKILHPLDAQVIDALVASRVILSMGDGLYCLPEKRAFGEVIEADAGPGEAAAAQ